MHNCEFGEEQARVVGWPVGVIPRFPRSASHVAVVEG